MYSNNRSTVHLLVWRQVGSKQARFYLVYSFYHNVSTSSINCVWRTILKLKVLCTYISHFKQTWLGEECKDLDTFYINNFFVFHFSFIFCFIVILI